MVKKTYILLSFSLLIIILLGCQGPAPEPTSPAAPTATQIPQVTEAPESDPAPSPEPTGEVSQSENKAFPTTAPDATPTEDTRPLPADWQSWPVIPTLSPAMIEVYQQGIALGNREDAFSKIGDCQIIPDAFIGLFDNPNYVLPDRIAHLQETLDRFQGSFGREGYSLKGGFVFPTVFSPLRADLAVCNPGETPLECELRVHRPSFVYIAMEFRYEGRTAETHERYLRQTVEYALSRGIVPILSTKADNYEGDHSLNLTTAGIAYEYDLPLINYWASVQYMPDKGLDYDFDQLGFHTTHEARLVRSEQFLEVLDQLYRQAQGDQ